MATISKQKYQCFTCRDNGFPDEFVYLAGKDEHGKVIRVEENGSAHVHKTKLAKNQSQQQQPNQSSTTVVTQGTILKIIDAKLDRVIRLLEDKDKDK